MIGQSAGNQFIYMLESSETICNKFMLKKKISEHVPTHFKPLNDDQFGHYLAGLIDGDGHFSSELQLVICFNSKDKFLAYYLKKIIGFGNVYEIKGKNAVNYVISKKDGIIKILNLINGKLRNKDKLDQINKYFKTNVKYSDFFIDFKRNDTNDLDNHWLAGFSDADASFQIKKPSNRNEVKLNFQVDQKYDYLLNLIKNLFGGNLGYRLSQDTYYYGSTSFKSAKNVIKYFDQYHLQSSKYKNYLIWRKAYIIIQDKKHLTDEGLNKILLLKQKLNK